MTPFNVSYGDVFIGVPINLNVTNMSSVRLNISYVELPFKYYGYQCLGGIRIL